MLRFREIAVLDTSNLSRQVLKNLMFLAPKDERSHHRTSLGDTLMREESSMVLVGCLCLVLEDALEILLSSDEKVWHDECEQ